eukprot:5255109-Amphidinium_carterae.1
MPLVLFPKYLYVSCQTGCSPPCTCACCCACIQFLLCHYKGLALADDDHVEEKVDVLDHGGDDVTSTLKASKTTKKCNK